MSLEWILLVWLFFGALWYWAGRGDRRASVITMECGCETQVLRAGDLAAVVTEPCPFHAIVNGQF